VIIGQAREERDITMILFTHTPSPSPVATPGTFI